MSQVLCATLCNLKLGVDWCLCLLSLAQGSGCLRLQWKGGLGSGGVLDYSTGQHCWVCD